MGGLFQGDDYVKYFHQREAINGGMAIVRGNISNPLFILLDEG